jgi:hypothetical protein
MVARRSVWRLGSMSEGKAHLVVVQDERRNAQQRQPVRKVTGQYEC